MVASRLKYIADAQAINRYTITAALDWPTVASRWIDHATALLAAPTSKRIAINYNRWFANNEYRDELASYFGGTPNVAASLENIPEFGRGSSFDGLERNGYASSMNVLHRWQDLSEQLRPAYMRIIDSERVAVDALNRRIFGFGYTEVTDLL